MRTAKYHDYTLLRILLFVALVVLGIFAYKHFVKSPCEHTSSNGWVTVEATCTEDGYRYKVCKDCGEQFGNQTLAALGHKIDNTVIEIEAATCTKTGTGYKACSVCSEQLEFVEIPVVEHTYGDLVVENAKHTDTKGDSFEYENVVYCLECNGEISREKVEVKHSIKESVITTDATCEKAGSEETIVYCEDCNEIISIETKEIEIIPHAFDWTLTYENGDFIFSAECDDCNHKYDSKTDSGYQFTVSKDESKSVKPSCVGGYNIHVGTVYLNGVKVAEVTVKEILSADPEISHSLYVKVMAEDEQTGEMKWTVMNPEDYAGYNVNDDGYLADEEGNSINFLDYSLEDEDGVYYNISTLGFVKVKNNEWDENGFALGVFRCTTNPVGHEFDHWITVRVYNDLAENGSVEGDLA